MKNNDTKRFTNLVLLVNVIILTIVSIVLLLLQQYSLVIGYAMGSITSYITYLMHVNNINKLDINTKNPVKKTVASALLRFFISAIVLLVALYVNWINLYATFIGLLVIKLTIIICGFIMEIRKNKGGNIETQ